MKQTIVIRVSMNNHKCRSKALKISVGISGVDSAALKGDDKNQIEVTGDGIDVVELTKLIRKNVGPAELISVGEKKEEKKEEALLQPLVYHPYSGEALLQPLVYHPAYSEGMYQISEYRESSRDPGCQIM